MNQDSELFQRKLDVIHFMDRIAEVRNSYIDKNRYYYQEIKKLLCHFVPKGSRVLEIGCGTGHILDALEPEYGVGIDISAKMIDIAKTQYPHLMFFQMDAENLTLVDKFDYIVISDTLGYLEDIQEAIGQLWKVSHADTRIIITYHSFLWHPVLSLAEKLKLKMPQMRLNWLSHQDVHNLLSVEMFDIVKKGQKFIFPKFVPGLSWFCNKYLSQIFPFSMLCIIGYTIARPFIPHPEKDLTVSVIIPARNERGNIQDAVKRCPTMGKHTELIFIEGHSQDGTLEEIERVCKTSPKTIDVKYAVQDGVGKGDAVRKGFALATGDILMIQDGDLTAPPEDLPKFFRAIASGKGEFINGSRLVYPMEQEAMRTLNIYGNRFFSLMFTWILGQPLKDTLCGTKVIHRKNWEKLVRNREYFGDFDPFGDFDLIFGSAKLNLKIIEIPVRYRARQYGATNISRFRHGWLLLQMVFFAMNKIKFI
jgi:SAM-dependent methyltransferase